MSDQNQNKISLTDKFVEFISKNIIQVFVGFCLIVLVVPFLFTRSWFGFASSKTGYVGDTIGGLTAPFIGLFSALLVYIAFKEQVKANLKLEDFNREQLKLNNKQNRVVELQNIFFLLEYIGKSEVELELQKPLPKDEYLIGIAAINYVIYIDIKTLEFNDLYHLSSRVNSFKLKITKFYNFLEMVMYEIQISNLDKAYKLTLLSNIDKFAFAQDILSIPTESILGQHTDMVVSIKSDFYEARNEILNCVKRFYMLHHTTVEEIRKL